MKILRIGQEQEQRVARRNEAFRQDLIGQPQGMVFSWGLLDGGVRVEAESREVDLASWGRRQLRLRYRLKLPCVKLVVN